MDIVEKMRRGMSELEVYPVEDIERWKSSGEMAFNGEKHLYEKGDNGVSDQVKLRSLGFRYHNGDEEIQYPAHVVGTEVNSHGI